MATPSLRERINDYFADRIDNPLAREVVVQSMVQYIESTGIIRVDAPMPEMLWETMRQTFETDPLMGRMMQAAEDFDLSRLQN